MFDIVAIEDIGTFIVVLVGGAGLYERTVKMSDEEIAAFRKGGEKACDRLVSEICRGWHKDREYIDAKYQHHKGT